MLDPNQHVVDPDTGFHVDKDTGRLVGIEEAVKPQPQLNPEWPKWVVPDESHVSRVKREGFPDHVTAPLWSDFHVNRVDGVVTVLVKDEDEEHRALAAAKAPEPEEAKIEEIKAEEIKEEDARHDQELEAIHEDSPHRV